MSLWPAEAIAVGAARLEVPLAPDAADLLADLVALTLHHNRRINLIGRCTVEQAIDRHVHDGLALLRILDRPLVAAEAPAWLDVGAGGGFPGLVLAIARPGLKLCLVEPIAKKAALVARAAHQLGLHNVEVREARLEDLDPETVPPAALSRATFPPFEWLERAGALLPAGGLVLVVMGGEPDPRVVARAHEVDRVTLPISGAARVNALVRVGDKAPAFLV